MKTLLLIVVLLMGITVAQAQALKKKYSGDFIGDIPAYAMDFEGETVQIKTATIRIILSVDGTCELIISGKSVSGTYRIVQEDNVSYTLEAKVDNNQAPEEWILYKKDKRLERKGVYPQPSAFLTKKS